MTKLLIERKARTHWTSQQVSDGVETLHHSQSIKEKHHSWRASVLHSWCVRPLDSSPFGQTKKKDLLHEMQRMENISVLPREEMIKVSKICRYYRYQHSTPTFSPTVKLFAALLNFSTKTLIQSVESSLAQLWPTSLTVSNRSFLVINGAVSMLLWSPHTIRAMSWAWER